MTQNKIKRPIKRDIAQVFQLDKMKIKRELKKIVSIYTRIKWIFGGGGMGDLGELKKTFLKVLLRTS